MGRTVWLLLGSALVVGVGLMLLLSWRGPVGSLRGLWSAAMAPWLIALVLLAALEWRLVVALARARVPERRRGAGALAVAPASCRPSCRRDGGATHWQPGAAAPHQRGTAVLEFALLFPIAVMVLMIMVQLSLLMHGNLVINYAAYAATRSAVVQVPRDLVGEGRNVLVDDPPGAKMERIRRAAVLAVTPISGRVPPTAAALAIQADMRLLYDQAGELPHAGLNEAFAQKFTYAEAHTRTVEVGPPQGIDFAPLQAVRVVIEHDLEASVPFARAIFADGSFEDSQGVIHYYTTVQAHYQLTNEGPRPEPVEPYCPEPPPQPPVWHPPHTGCPYH